MGLYALIEPCKACERYESTFDSPLCLSCRGESLHPQNHRVGDEGLRGMMEYLNYYRRPPMYVPIDGEAIQHENPLCPELDGAYRMMCAEEALYACGERHCQTCELKRGRIDFISDNSERTDHCLGPDNDRGGGS